MDVPVLRLVLDNETVREDGNDEVVANTTSLTEYGGSSMHPSKRRAL
mgnify:CR=1 FL=1